MQERCNYQEPIMTENQLCLLVFMNQLSSIQNKEYFLFEKPLISSIASSFLLLCDVLFSYRHLCISSTDQSYLLLAHFQLSIMYFHSWPAEIGQKEQLGVAPYVKKQFHLLKTVMNIQNRKRYLNNPLLKTVFWQANG